jgi:Na+/H+-dicarboxylate symporter
MPFSKKWMWISFSTFIVIEILLGVFLGQFIVGKYLSIHLNFLMQGLLNLLSYFIGGIIIGFISPGIRKYEPAVGALLSVATMLILTFFTPYSFLHFSFTKLVVGGIIAFFLALSGAKIGERFSGNKI